MLRMRYVGYCPRCKRERNKEIEVYYQLTKHPDYELDLTERCLDCDLQRSLKSYEWGPYMKTYIDYLEWDEKE